MERRSMKTDGNVRLITAGISGKKAILPMVIVGIVQTAYLIALVVAFTEYTDHDCGKNMKMCFYGIFIITISIIIIIGGLRFLPKTFFCIMFIIFLFNFIWWIVTQVYFFDKAQREYCQTNFEIMFVLELIYIIEGYLSLAFFAFCLIIVICALTRRPSESAMDDEALLPPSFN